MNRRNLPSVSFAFMVMLMLATTCQAASLWTAGHGDLRLTYESGVFDLFYRIDNSTVDGTHVELGEYAPEDLIIVVPDGFVGRPPGSEWDFTGNAEGEPLWYIELSQLPDRPWPGISTESLIAADFVGNLSYSLTDFTGPGNLSLVTFGPFGDPTIYFQTNNGLSADDAIHVPVGTHAHYAWLFTAPGKYTLEIVASGHLSAAAGGGSVSDAGTFTVWVAVPEPVGVALPLTGLAALVGAWRGRRTVLRPKAVWIATLGVVLPAASAHAAHIDIVPYFEVIPGGNYTFSVGSFDFNKTGNIANGLPPAPLKRNVLVFTGGIQQNPINGRFVNGDPGWDLPPDAVENDGYGAEYPVGTLPPRGGQLKFNVVADPRLGRNLSYWDGTGVPSFSPVPNGEILDIFEPASFGLPDSVTLNGANVSVPGFELTSGPLWPGSFHTHTSHVLWGDALRSAAPDDLPTPGFYLFSLNMEIEDGLLFPNYPEFDGIVAGIRAVSPTFHVILAHGFANGSDQYIYGDPLYDYLYGENGEIVLDENGEPILVPVLDDQGNPVLDVIGVGDFILGPEMRLAADWVHTNLAPVPEPTSAMFATIGALSVALLGRSRLRSRRGDA